MHDRHVMAAVACIRRCGSWRRLILLGALVVVAAVGWPAAAAACTPNLSRMVTAIPRSGTTNVSTMTSILMASEIQPGPITLLANGTAVGPLSVTELGRGQDGLGPTTRFWRLRIGAAGFDEPLMGDTEYVLQVAAGSDGGQPEVTRFTTAAGYDKEKGTPAVIKSVRLWRVRYPVKDIAGGNCVFDEYHGFIKVDYEQATFPATQPDAVVHTLTLRPQNGTSTQSFIHVGTTPFKGQEPVGEYPSPIGSWLPDLDPTRPYCLTISAFGDGDRARLSVTSEPVCAEVVQLSATGAPPPPEGGTGGTMGVDEDAGVGTGGAAGTAARGGGGGCSIGRPGGERAAGAAAALALLVLLAARSGKTSRPPRLRSRLR